ncbi:MAG: DUF4202 domain-containing protein [Candidatus Omnitrophica bacterium]|nr:DUF4202 domain-containing protein [Candidatus Omnitrophota bacterium]
MPSERFAKVIEQIDQLNSQDPNQELINGVPHPRERLYAQRVSDWVRRLDPHGSEALRIAAHGQHVRRWTIPRHRYEMNRRGYLRWRETLKAFHADTVGGLMRQAGYPEAMIQRVQTIMSKRRLPEDPKTQTLEDALCLVFLQTQFSELRAKTPDDTMREILRKTWKKMSRRGRAAALQGQFTDEDRTFLAQAIAGVD